ncbi:hypothetical protein HY441_01830 [Candidatus Microgenomates bacterium]|nr:hypothetical protein [Candidatus Microgenomates bacterium]
MAGNGSADQSEVRRHYYLDQYVVIAPKRTHALHHIDYTKSGALKSPPLETETAILEIPGADDEWAVKVVRNLYPAFTPGNKQAFGIQEVVLETNPVDIPFCRLAVEQLERVFSAFRQRITELRKLKDISYVSIFHNEGLEAGASVRQIHSQIIATGVAPTDLVRQARIFAKFKQRYGQSPLKRAMAWEEEQFARVIHSDRLITVVAPYASQFPYEAWLVPKRAILSICDLKPKELNILAKTLKAITQALESEQMTYNFLLYEDVRGYDNHFYIKIVPRPNVWAGFELNTGIAINPVAPEEAARWYRQFIKEHNAL